MEVQISRDGSVIGVLQLEEIGAAVAGGTILPTDYAWHEGMAEWKLVSELAPAKKGKKTAAKKTPKEKKDWRQEPATEKQIAYLESFGVPAQASLTKGQASDLIDHYANDPKARKAQQEKRQAAQEAALEEARRDMEERPAYWFRRKVEKAKQEVAKEVARGARHKISNSEKKKALAALQKKLAAAKENEKEPIEEEIEDLEADLIDLEYDPLDLKDYKDELKQAESARVKFWKATFKEDWIMSADGEDYDILGDVSASIDRFYEAYGRHFRPPTNKQISDILEALDQAYGEWDKAQPEAFYGRLQQNFPDQMRTAASESRGTRPKASRAKRKGGGCLVLLAGVLVIVCAFAWC
jgi:hypothetical protein